MTFEQYQKVLCLFGLRDDSSPQAIRDARADILLKASLIGTAPEGQNTAAVNAILKTFRLLREFRLQHTKRNAPENDSVSLDPAAVAAADIAALDIFQTMEKYGNGFTATDIAAEKIIAHYGNEPGLIAQNAADILRYVDGGGGQKNVVAITQIIVEQLAPTRGLPLTRAIIDDMKNPVLLTILSALPSVTCPDMVRKVLAAAAPPREALFYPPKMRETAYMVQCIYTNAPNLIWSTARDVTSHFEGFGAYPAVSRLLETMISLVQDSHVLGAKLPATLLDGFEDQNIREALAPHLHKSLPSQTPRLAAPAV